MILRQIPKYVVVGAFCALVYNAVMLLGDHLHAHYVASTLAAFGLLVVLGYVLHCKYTFSEAMSLRGLTRYTGAMALSLPMSTGGMFVLRDVMHAPMAVAAPALTATLFGWNFLSARWAVISRRLKARADRVDEAAR